MYVVNPRATTNHSLSIEEIKWSYLKNARKSRKRKIRKTNGENRKQIESMF